MERKKEEEARRHRFIVVWRGGMDELHWRKKTFSSIDSLSVTAESLTQEKIMEGKFYKVLLV